MLSLEKALQDHELIVLRTIGEWWDLDLTGLDKKACIKALVETLLQLDVQQELTYLPAEELAAMQTLFAAGGRLLKATFSRDHGEVRLMGPAALEREEPWLEPISATEALWYRGFLYSGFDDSGDGLEEYFFIPDDLLAHFLALEPETETGVESKKPKSNPSPAPITTAAAPESFEPATTDAVDDMTTLLAFAQNTQLKIGEGHKLQPYLLNPNSDRLGLLTTLATEMGLLLGVDDRYKPTRETVTWLQQRREVQMRTLWEAWSSSAWNELRHVPQLQCEGSGWSNDPILARTALLDALTLVPEWHVVDEIVATIQKHHPDFQRPNGNYDTWYIRDVETGKYLTGFENWVLVEGRLLRYLLQTPMTWLGLVEVGDGRYRLSPHALEWLKNDPAESEDIPVPILVQNDATLLIPFNTDRYQRFQASRFGEMLPCVLGKPFRYRITPGSLQQAREQKISTGRVLEFLAKASGRPIPAGTKRAIERWSENGTEGQVEPVVILRVRDAEIIEKLRQNPKAQPFIRESLGELAVVVDSEQWQALVQVAAQLGLLLDVPAE